MKHFDIRIKNGTIVEGTGLPRFQGDIGIKNGHITKIGKIDPSHAQRRKVSTRWKPCSISALPAN